MMMRSIGIIIEKCQIMRIQGSTALCGLCALNNAYQVNVFDIVMLNQLVDEL